MRAPDRGRDGLGREAEQDGVGRQRVADRARDVGRGRLRRQPGHRAVDGVERVVGLEEEVAGEPEAGDAPSSTSRSTTTSLPPGTLYSPCSDVDGYSPRGAADRSCGRLLREHVRLDPARRGRRSPRRGSSRCRPRAARPRTRAGSRRAAAARRGTPSRAAPRCGDRQGVVDPTWISRGSAGGSLLAGRPIRRRVSRTPSSCIVVASSFNGSATHAAPMAGSRLSHSTPEEPSAGASGSGRPRSSSPGRGRPCR